MLLVRAGVERNLELETFSVCNRGFGSSYSLRCHLGGYVQFKIPRSKRDTNETRILAATTGHGAKTRGPQILKESSFRTLKNFKNATNDTYHIFNCSTDPTNLTIEFLWSEPLAAADNLQLRPADTTNTSSTTAGLVRPVQRQRDQRRYRHQLALEPIDTTTYYPLLTGLIKVG